MARHHPRVLVACRTFGVPSEVWIQRQMATLGDCEPQVLSWDVAPGAQPRPGLPVHQLDIDFDAPERGMLRWWRRLLAWPTGNVCGAAGAERKKLERLFDQIQPDVVLCHFGPVALRLLAVARARGVPVVAHFHGNDISSSLQNNRYYRWSLRRSLPQLAAAVVVGSHQQRILRDMGLPEEKIALIPCGAPVELFTPKRAYETDRCRFITVSRLVEWKGVHYTLEAFARSRQQRPELELHIVGTGSEGPALRELADRLQVTEAVVFHGEKTPEEVRRLMTACDVFVQHSLDHHSGWTEGFGVSIAEASACGLPVLVTNSGGIVDQVTDRENGLVTPQRDVGRLSEAMLELAGDPWLRQRLGQAGRERVTRHFDSTARSRQLERWLFTAARLPAPVQSPSR